MDFALSIFPVREIMKQSTYLSKLIFLIGKNYASINLI